MGRRRLKLGCFAYPTANVASNFAYLAKFPDNRQFFPNLNPPPKSEGMRMKGREKGKEVVRYT